MTIIVHDLFSGGTITDGTDIGGRTPDTVNLPGATWEQSGANSIELDGAGACKGAAANNMASYLTGRTDLSAYYLWNRGGADNRGGMFLRASGAVAFVAGWDGYLLSLRSDTSEILVRYYVDNSPVTIETITGVTVNTNTDYWVGLSVTGSSLRAYFGTSFPPPAVGAGATDANVDGVTVGGTRASFIHFNRADATGRFKEFIVDNAIRGIGLTRSLRTDRLSLT